MRERRPWARAKTQGASSTRGRAAPRSPPRGSGERVSRRGRSGPMHRGRSWFLFVVSRGFEEREERAHHCTCPDRRTAERVSPVRHRRDESDIMIDSHDETERAVSAREHQCPEYEKTKCDRVGVAQNHGFQPGMRSFTAASATLRAYD